ncbi:MAG: MFS transporter [Prolixibacteraceae bacterium]|nr:MFS transporter [Burkholderiales bacterium]
METIDIGAAAVAKVRRRLLPLMIICFFIAFLDRVNVGFAALQMNEDLGFSAKIYGFGAGIFFIGYFLFEVPSNLILHRIGARIWIARIMITWGLIAAGMAFVQGTTSFYVMRFLLGVAEAGFFPGMILYISLWFPARERARATAIFILGLPISVLLGAPLSVALLSLDGLAGFQGWQWLFVIEGIPAVVLGFVVLAYLTDRPAEAKWLTAEQRDWLVARLAAEAAATARVRTLTVGQTLRNKEVLTLAFAFLCNVVPIYGITMWLPLIAKSAGDLTNFQTGMVTTVPYVCAAVAMVINARHSDRTGERKLHILVAALIGACGFVLAATAASPYIGLLGLCIGAAGIWCANTVFWTLPASILTGAAAAAGIGLINAVGNLGGFIGPYMTGWIRESFGGFGPAMLCLAAFLTLHGIVLYFFVRRAERRAELIVAPVGGTVAQGSPGSA